MRKASHVAYEAYKGPINSMHVLHTCDNPKCVNPEHLWLGTHVDNMKDRHSKGRYDTMPKGSNHPMSKLTWEQVTAIREDPRSQRKIAVDYNISHTMIGYIKRGENWTYPNES